MLTKDAGLLAELLLPFKLGVGGPVAGGRNYMPWISLADEVGLLLWALDTEAASGVYNACAPNPVTNREFSKSLGRALKRPAIMPVPKFAVKVRLGAELGEVATGGQRALPRRAQDEGYVFRFPEIDAAMKDARRLGAGRARGQGTLIARGAGVRPPSPSASYAPTCASVVSPTSSIE